MRKFKFFQKPVNGDLTMFDGQTQSTSSFYGELPPLHEWDTPQGHNGRRRLYHTNPEEYERQRREREELRWRFRSGNLNDEDRNRFDRLRSTNDDMERYFIENGFRDFNDNPVEQVRSRINGGSNLPMPKLSLYRRFINELMDDNKPHKLILLALFILGGITVLLHYYTQR
jgi:hypothetical protein